MSGMNEPVPEMIRITVRMEFANGRVWECDVPKPVRPSMTLDLASRMAIGPFNPAVIMIPPPSARRVKLDFEANPSVDPLLVWRQVPDSAS
jgi:hypothetical protein